MKSRKQNQFVWFASVTVMAWLSFGFGSCSLSVNEICAVKLPALDRRLLAGISALEPSGTSRGMNREIASDAHSLGSDDRETWRRWAEDQLFETQHYIDAISFDGSGTHARQELTEIANQLVMFHGYTQTGNVGRMVATLKIIQGHAVKVCSL